MKKILLSLIAGGLLATSTHAFAESHYVSEHLLTYLHTGPGTNYRILGSVNSGEALTLKEMSDDGKFAKVTDTKNRTGWIAASALANGISNSQKIEQLQTQLNSITTEQQNQQQTIGNKLNQIEKLESELSQAKQELAEVKDSKETLENKLNNYSDEVKMKWFVNGGMVAGGGVLLGLILSLFPRSKKKRSSWA